MGDRIKLTYLTYITHFHHRKWWQFWRPKVWTTEEQVIQSDTIKLHDSECVQFEGVIYKILKVELLEGKDNSYWLETGD